MTKRMKVILPVLVVLIVLWGLVNYLVVSNQFTAIDSSVYAHLTVSLNAQLTLFMQIITVCGSILVIGALAMVLLAFSKKRGWVVLIILITAATQGASLMLKSFFDRPRPTILHLATAYGYSYPSSSVLIAAVFYGLAGYYLIEKTEKQWIKGCIVGLYTVLVIGISVSRVYLGVNYFSDVLGAWIFAALILVTLVLLMECVFLYQQYLLKKKAEAKRNEIEDIVTKQEELQEIHPQPLA